jgi:hypothetical protein
MDDSTSHAGKFPAKRKQKSQQTLVGAGFGQLFEVGKLGPGKVSRVSRISRSARA